MFDKFTTFFLISLSFLLCLNSQARSIPNALNTSRSIESLLQEIQMTQFQFKERGSMFGYVSTQSCLYTSERLLILHNYCFPKRQYPARSFTVISQSHGTFYFYEESYGNFLKRDIELRHFPEVIVPELPADFRSLDIAQLHQIFKDIYYTYNNPACWSTNYSSNYNGPDSRCYRTDTQLHQDWLTESLTLVEDPSGWKDLFDLLEGKIM
ncbi:MAG: hypothetical protein KDD61_18220 [Bdellovibrionales bacterium]|nr:hypothetical protein [Bdellovibrionales bacterium]